MNSQKCNWYTWDSIAFIALLFDGLLVNADEQKNLAISKTERAKNGRKKWLISNLLKTTTSTFTKTYRLSWQNVKMPVLLNPQSHGVFKQLFSIYFPCYLGNWTFHCTLKAVHWPLNISNFRLFLKHDLGRSAVSFRKQLFQPLLSSRLSHEHDLRMVHHSPRESNYKASAYIAVKHLLQVFRQRGGLWCRWLRTQCQ